MFFTKHCFGFTENSELIISSYSLLNAHVRDRQLLRVLVAIGFEASNKFSSIREGPQNQNWLKSHLRLAFVVINYVKVA